jgi:hypothetical protein
VVQQRLALQAGVAVVAMQSVEAGVVSRVRLTCNIGQTGTVVLSHIARPHCIGRGRKTLSTVAPFLATAMLAFLRSSYRFPYALIV